MSITREKMYMATCDGCGELLNNFGDESYAVAIDRDELKATMEMNDWTTVKGPFGREKVYCDKSRCQKKSEKS